MITLRKVKNWEFFKDSINGVTAFANTNINFQSDWNTGNDAETEIKEVLAMTDDEFLSYARNLIPLPF